MKAFTQYNTFPVTPEVLFRAFTNAFTLELWTGEPAHSDVRPGGAFSWLDGNIVGKYLDIEHDKMIRQQWFFGAESSEAELILKFHSKGSGTSLETRFTNLPIEAAEDIKQGWNDVVITNLQAYYSEEQTVN